MSGEVPEGGLPDFDFERASEPERWIHDQGIEDGRRAMREELLDKLDATLERLIGELRRMAAEMRSTP